MLKITSRDNNKLKSVRKIRDGKVEDFIFIEGVRLVEEALKSNLKLSEVFISESFSANEYFLKRLESLQIFTIPDKIFDSIADTKSSQGIVLIAKKPNNNKFLLDADNQKSLVILLHEINNPSNLGAILRTAEAFGVAGIITTRNSANVFSSKSLRGSMGASFRLPVWENADFDEVLDWAKLNKLKTISADINAEKSLTEINWNEKYLLVFGSEAHGLTVLEREKIDESVYIPMENNVESLNLAVACGIILFEAKRK